MIKSRSFTLNGKGRLSVLITDCEVAAPKAANPAAVKSKYKAIWDTGASRTMITQRIVDDCGLVPIRPTKINTAGGPQDSELYLVDVSLLHGVNVTGVTVARGTLGSGVDMLIGMDIITLGDFAITNVGGVTKFSFRIPSLVTHDYVQEAKEAKITAPRPSPIKNSIPKVGRNEKCPCGSDKKYKHCHGAP